MNAHLMQPTVSIRAENLGKSFRYYTNKWRKLGSAFFETGNHAHILWAVRNINLQLEPGTTLGIIGLNGSGKTTLLQLLAGLLKPNEGKVEVHGNLATLLDLQGGFQQDLTGRENIFVSCGLRGFSRKHVEKRIDEIIHFAELEPYIDHPIRHYSSGMLLRLAFATAIHVQPEVLLIDEVFAVGDLFFQHKCAKKFRELQAKGTTIVLATHDMMAVKSLCHQAILLVSGEVAKAGRPEDVTNVYLALIAEKIAEQNGKTAAPILNTHQQNCFHRHGTGEAQIISTQILVNGRPAENMIHGDQSTFRFHLEYFADVPESILGFYIRDRYGNDVIGINTFEEQKPIGPRKKGDRILVEFQIQVYLKEGTYSVSPGLSYHPTDMRYLDWVDQMAFFHVQSSGKQVHGFFWVPSTITISEEL